MFRFKVHFLTAVCIFSFQGCIPIPVSYQKFSSIDGSVKQGSQPVGQVKVWYARDKKCVPTSSLNTVSSDDGHFHLNGSRSFPIVISFLGTRNCQPIVCFRTTDNKVYTSAATLSGCFGGPQSLIAECNLDSSDAVCKMSESES